MSANSMNRLARVDTRWTILTWMVGANLMLTIVILGSLFPLWSKISDITDQLAQISAKLH